MAPKGWTRPARSRPVFMDDLSDWARTPLKMIAKEVAYQAGATMVNEGDRLRRCSSCGRAS